jgi:hemoglobin-like flavoprotein
MISVSPRHFDLLGKNLIVGLGEVLGDSFTSDAKDAWLILYTMLAAMLQERMHAHNKTVSYANELAPKEGFATSK